MMKVFEGTDLPDDFVVQVKRYAREKFQDRTKAVPDAVLEILGRPLTAREKLSIIDAMNSVRLCDSIR
jgi:hypothetical protein